MEEVMSGCSGKVREISLGEDFGDVAVKVNGVLVVIHTDGSLLAYTNKSVEAYTSGPVQVHAPASNDAKPDAARKIGAVEKTGKHKGEIYGGIYPADNKPIWFSASPKLMDHYAAAAWANEQGGALPTRKHGDYLTRLKNRGGAFREIFKRGNSFPAGLVWLAEPTYNGSGTAWCQRLSDGDQNSHNLRGVKLPVLTVLR